MNAAPNAGVRKWKTAVHAVADAGKGPVWVSSQLFTIEVAAPLVTLDDGAPGGRTGADDTQLFCKVAVATPFEGKAKVTIYGLPAKVTTQVLELTKDTKELAFPIVADKASPAGQARRHLRQIVIDKGGELIASNTGGTRTADRRAAAAEGRGRDADAEPHDAEPPMPPAGPPEKRLTRLEKLRLEQEEREKAAAGQPPAKKEEPKKN